MCTEEYKRLWLETIRACETESTKDEAQSFVFQFYDKRGLFESLDDKTLLQTFVSLVVYEQRHSIKLGSTTPASFCYRVLLDRARMSKFDMEFILDVGDWAADYSDNDYVPMGNCHGYGPREYFDFTFELEMRISSERQAKQERLESNVLREKQRLWLQSKESKSVLTRFKN